ncbi:MAG TPA: acyl-CoA dehydrogenase [Steroidobacteraceae bacterium]|jgi:alkylation response protein AidB-like acyl-CoA dehydrogenase|nr:acyl-CoA dehydrogenase [Steroidobacteraceae bacterium]
MYQAPLSDLRFVLEELLEVGSLGRSPRYSDFAIELLGQILEEAARFAEQVLAPINRLGDQVGASFRDGRVQMPEQFRVAYRQFVEGGWTTLTAGAEHGGQGQPLVLAAAVEEIWSGANVAFTLCPLLARGAVETLERNGAPALLARLLPNIVSGLWTGTMNLTEPQAGSDLAAIRTRATPEGDHYRLSGQKIFITYGEHDMAENIVHMVLARIDGAPAGVHGISMFAVPKRLLGSDGAAGEANDLHCVSIEHKLGIHASPTCVMSYGDHGGALGYLIGEPNHGLEYMFVMMNSARLSVGVQGIGLSELALQQARAWAQGRVQGHAVGVPGRVAGPIIEHPDVRRMLLTIRANVEAMRALALYAALELDRARAEPDPTRAAAALARGELLIPIVKGWCTEQATTLASLSVQIHGGMGFIEETGVAQTLRDVRITSIYEGTTGIQANDLLGRKLARDRGAAMAALLRDMLRELNELRGDEPALRSSRNATIEALTYLRDATETLLQQAGEDAPRAYAVSVPYLQLAGRVLGGALMARSAGIAARSAGSADASFYRAKLQSARFYAEHLLPEALALLRIVKSGGASVAEAAPDLI